MSGAADLTGKTVLVVEDEYYVAADTAAALRSAGATVLGPCATEDGVRKMLADHTPHAAVVDLNLGGGGPRFEIAHMLKKQGTPFVFFTGYDPDVVPHDLSDVTQLLKPASMREVVEAVSRL